MNYEQKKLDLESLVNRLIEKSKLGKLTWKPTANRKEFVTSVGGGNTSFKMRIEAITDYDPWGNLETFDVPRLDILDEKGLLLWKISKRDVPSGKLDDLYKIAQRISNEVDDRIDEAIEALDKI